MDFAHIAELTPELPARNTKQFKAAVTLIWPWSSSQRQFALLLAEPDFRLRRKKGQVRARFSGSSAKALATTGVGIGDEVVLSLRGAQFVQEGTVSTPGRSIDWELEYTQTVAVQVFRHGKEIANLDIVDAAPTPAPRSPVRQQTNTNSSHVQQWSSPAFLKRARLSDGPFFEAPYDPLAEETTQGHDKKRRRKSYRDWKAWTYSARTPSPEKDHVGTEDDFDSLEPSPSCRAQLPHTPVSPPNRGLLSVAAGQLDGTSDAIELRARASTPDLIDGETDSRKFSQLPDPHNFASDDNNDDLYAEPDKDRPADAQYAFGGDTEANTEDEELEDTDIGSKSPTEADLEEVQELYQCEVEEPETVAGTFDAGTTTEDGSLFEPSESQHTAEVIMEDMESAMFYTPEDALAIALPPPTLPTLDPNLSTTHVPGMLTPLGKEPSSPKLEPLDSALLPLPSPFPGERDINMTSFLDQITSDQVPEQPQAEDEEPPSEASYILENSFFRSINSTKAAAFHPEHESAFTPVRFTFGMDGAGYSGRLNLSSPAPETAKENPGEKGKRFAVEDALIESHTVPETIPVGPLAGDWESVHHGGPATLAPIGDEESAAESDTQGESMEQEDLSALPDAFEGKRTAPDVIELSSDSGEEEKSEESEVEDVTGADQGLVGDSDVLDSHNMLSHDDYGPTSTNRSAAATEIVDLGSPSGSSDMEETISYSPHEDFRGAEGKGVDLPTAMSTGSQDLNFPPDELPDDTEQTQSHCELNAMDFAPANLDFPASTQREESTHATTQQGTRDIMRHGDNSHCWTAENIEARRSMDDLDAVMHDSFAQDESFDVGPWVTEDVDDDHPDVKVESIEEGSVFQYSGLDVQQGQDDKIKARPSDEIQIEVPEEGHKVGELHTISVPATGPARNTRSKAKTSTSPTKLEMSPVKRATRSTSVDSVSDTGKSHSRDVDPFLTSFVPSQELSASQGKFSEVGFVKDSEEESLHSEHSLSTVRYSDDWNTFTNFSDPPVDSARDDDLEHLKPPPASAPDASTRGSTRLRGTRSERQTVLSDRSNPKQERYSSIKQPSPSTPKRGLRSTTSTELDLTSPRGLRVLRRSARLSSSPVQRIEAFSDVATPKAHLTLPDTIEVVDLRSSPSAQADADEVIRSSPPAAATYKQSLMTNSKPITPEATQRTNMESQSDLVSSQQQQSLLMTPQLTQTASARSKSFKASMDEETTTALPTANAGDVVLLRAFAVKSLNRHPTLTSAEESSWCVWRYIKPVWGAKRGAFGELRAREEVKGPVVERGEGEWREVEKLREWWVGKVKGELDGMVGAHTRSHDKKEERPEVENQGMKTRSRDAIKREE
ncbi:hypothetical protein BDU57DRAFT_468374 [Ampelomyces quisqualis]|uniref:Telomeric single stranded DNA binding POT1/Cdc13 domain-containing protein n=1 Tax=Ampelomyces quisqualis TaxID=50730 RepID=A0A6A5QU35_AMPQU|nr:hypothetical protein BDU57DRAFT_468374 [Ampelomyces quisqualis]